MIFLNPALRSTVKIFLAYCLGGEGVSGHLLIYLHLKNVAFAPNHSYNDLLQLLFIPKQQYKLKFLYFLECVAEIVLQYFIVW